MKKIILILIASVYSNLYSQRTEEVMDASEGSKILYEKFTRNNTKLYIYKWTYDYQNTTCNVGYFQLTKKQNTNNISLPNLFFFNHSEINDNSVKSLYF